MVPKVNYPVHLNCWRTQPHTPCLGGYELYTDPCSATAYAFPLQNPQRLLMYHSLMNCNFIVARDTVTLYAGATEQTTFSPRKRTANYPTSGRCVHEYTVSALVEERRSRYIEPHVWIFFTQGRQLITIWNQTDISLNIVCCSTGLKKTLKFSLSCDLYDTRSEKFLNSINQFVSVVEWRNICLMYGKN